MNSNLLRILALFSILSAPLHANPEDGDKAAPEGNGLGNRILKNLWSNDEQDGDGEGSQTGRDLIPAAPNGASTSTGLVINEQPRAAPDEGVLRAMVQASGFKVSQPEMGNLLGLLSQAFSSGVSMQQLMAMNEALDAPLDGRLVQAVQGQLVAHQGQFNSLFMTTSNQGITITDLQRRATALDERSNTNDARVTHNTQRIDELFHNNPLVAVGRFIGQWLQAENVNGFAEKVFGFAPFTLASLPYLIPVLGGMEVATRLPGPFRPAVRPLRSLMWFTIALGSIRASKEGMDRFQQWVQRRYGQRIARLTGNRDDARRIATGISALVMLAALLWAQRRGMLRPPFMRKHKRNNN